MRHSRILALLLVLSLLAPMSMTIWPAPAITEDRQEGTRAKETGIEIIGNINTDTVWTYIPNYPYRVKNTISLVKDITLTIEPGVEVIFSEGVSFYINGTLKAVGNMYNSIYFKPSSENPGSQDWGGIVFENGSRDCVLDYVDISFASRGINCSIGTSPLIVNSTVAYSYYYAIYCGNESTPLIKNCRINNSLYAGIVCDNGSMPMIIDNHINTCMHGIIAYSGPRIYNNYIELCPVGILVWNSSSHLKGNEISHCYDGIFVFFCDPLVENNFIKSCQGNGTRFIGSNSTVLNNVMVFNDVGFDIPYDSKNIIANMSGNTVNGIPARDLYHVGLKDAVIKDLDIDSGHGSGYYGLLTNQGSITLYDCENVTIDNCTVKNNMNGIYTYNSSINIYNSHFESSRHGDVNLAETSSARSYNGSVNETRVLVGDGSYLVSYGLIQVQVRNYTHDSVADATVEIRELTFLLQNSTTNGTGLTPELLVQKRRVSTAGLFDYTLNVEVWSPGLTFDDNPRLVNMDDEVLVLFTDLGDIIKPEIADSEIENGQQDVDVNASITITFSEPMNRTSVEEAFSISGNMTGTLHWEGSNLTFVPDHPYDYLTSYTVIVSTDAKDIQGNNLKEQLTFRFTTEPERSIMSGSGIAIGIVVILAIIGIATFLILKRK